MILLAVLMLVFDFVVFRLLIDLFAVVVDAFFDFPFDLPLLLLEVAVTFDSTSLVLLLLLSLLVFIKMLLVGD